MSCMWFVVNTDIEAWLEKHGFWIGLFYSHFTPVFLTLTGLKNNSRSHSAFLSLLFCSQSVERTPACTAPLRPTCLSIDECGWSMDFTSWTLPWGCGWDETSVSILLTHSLFILIHSLQSNENTCQKTTGHIRQVALRCPSANQEGLIATLTANKEPMIFFFFSFFLHHFNEIVIQMLHSLILEKENI